MTEDLSIIPAVSVEKPEEIEVQQNVESECSDEQANTKNDNNSKRDQLQQDPPNLLGTKNNNKQHEQQSQSPNNQQEQIPSTQQEQITPTQHQYIPTASNPQLDSSTPQQDQSTSTTSELTPNQQSTKEKKLVQQTKEEDQPNPKQPTYENQNLSKQQNPKQQITESTNQETRLVDKSDKQLSNNQKEQNNNNQQEQVDKKQQEHIDNKQQEEYNNQQNQVNNNSDEQQNPLVILPECPGLPASLHYEEDEKRSRTHARLATLRKTPAKRQQTLQYTITEHKDKEEDEKMENPPNTINKTKAKKAKLLNTNPSQPTILHQAPHPQPPVQYQTPQPQSQPQCQFLFNNPTPLSCSLIHDIRVAQEQSYRHQQIMDEITSQQQRIEHELTHQREQQVLTNLQVDHLLAAYEYHNTHSL